MKYLLLLALPLTMTACASPKPEQTAKPSNQSYSVDQLFTDKNGVTIYRFYDAGDYRYYAVGPQGAHMLPSTTRTAPRQEVGVGIGVGVMR